MWNINSHFHLSESDFLSPDLIIQPKIYTKFPKKRLNRRLVLLLHSFISEKSWKYASAEHLDLNYGSQQTLICFETDEQAT